MPRISIKSSKKPAYRNFLKQWHKVIDFPQENWLTLIIVIVLISLFFVGGYLYFGNWKWTGFAEYEITTPQGTKQFYPGKTLWDILSLVIVPLALAITAFIFNQKQKEVEFSRAKQEREVERQIANDQSQEAALQIYFDRMSNLLLDKNLRSLKTVTTNEEKVVEASIIARALTLNVLRNLSPHRKSNILRFLYEMELIRCDNDKFVLGKNYYGEKKIVSLSNADFSGTNLNQVILPYIDLSDANLSGADLRRVSLYRANLSGADFSYANFQGAYLVEAMLIEANLTGANLAGANLEKATYNSKPKWPENFDLDLAGMEYTGLTRK